LIEIYDIWPDLITDPKLIKKCRKVRDNNPIYSRNNFRRKEAIKKALLRNPNPASVPIQVAIICLKRSATEEIGDLLVCRRCTAKLEREGVKDPEKEYRGAGRLF